MNKAIFLAIPILLFASRSESRQKGGKPRRNVQFTFATTNRETKEVKRHFSVRIDRSKDIDIEVDADEDIVNAFMAYGRSITEQAIDIIARESVNGFYGLPVEKQAKLMARLQKEFDLFNSDTITREFAKGFYELPVEKQVEFLIRTQDESDPFGDGSGAYGLRKMMQGVLQGIREEPTDKKKPKGGSSKAADVKTLKDLADSFFGKDAVKEKDIKDLMEGILGSSVSEKPQKGDKTKADKPDEE